MYKFIAFLLLVLSNSIKSKSTPIVDPPSQIQTSKPVIGIMVYPENINSKSEVVKHLLRHRYIYKINKSIVDMLEYSNARVIPIFI